MKRALLAFLLTLAGLAAAFGQQPPFPASLPPNTVVGNVSPVSAPASAVAISRLITASLFTATAPGLVPGSGGGVTAFLRADGTWAVPAGGGGGGTPGGVNGQVQYNAAGAFGGFTVGGDGTLNTTTGALTVTKTNGVAFAASATTDATNAANISAGTLPAARLPNPSATTLGGVESIAAIAHQWVNSISTLGVPALSQPAFTDISGTATAAQVPAMVASGASHAAGIVPDPGAVAGTTKFLREDATWQVPAGGGTPGGASLSVQYNNAGAFAGFGSYTAASHLLQIDAADAASPAAQTLQVQSVVGGTTNTAGVDFSIQGSLGTGTGAGGNILLKTAPAGTTGTTQNAASSLVVHAPNLLALRNGATAQALHVYNTVDTYPTTTNYERGVFDFTTITNTLTIGYQKNGTGAIRQVEFVGGDFAAANIGTAFWTSSAFGTPGIGTIVVVLGQNTTTGANTPTVVGYGPDNAPVVNLGTVSAVKAGWLNYAGQTRVTADFSVSNSTVLTNVTGLSVNLTAGRTYAFEAVLLCTDAGAGGVQAAISGTATATDIRYEGYTLDSNTVKGQTQAAALGTAVGSTTTTGTAPSVRINGTITVNAAGTLTVQMAQNTSNAIATVAKRGSYFIVQDIN